MMGAFFSLVLELEHCWLGRIFVPFYMDRALYDRKPSSVWRWIEFYILQGLLMFSELLLRKWKKKQFYAPWALCTWSCMFPSSFFFFLILYYVHFFYFKMSHPLVSHQVKILSSVFTYLLKTNSVQSMNRSILNYEMNFRWTCTVWVVSRQNRFIWKLMFGLDTKVQEDRDSGAQGSRNIKRSPTKWLPMFRQKSSKHTKIKTQSILMIQKNV